jgi:hypothetical protein
VPDVKYTKPGEVEYDSFYEPGDDENPRRMFGYTTVEVTGTDIFAIALRAWIRKTVGTRAYRALPKILMTTEACWSGYSEYTVTSNWTEVVITVPTMRFERHFDSIPEFFAALSQVERDKLG